MEFVLSKTETERGFLYIEKEDRGLIPLNNNNKVNVLIDGKKSEHSYDKNGRLFGLNSWFRSNKITSDTPIFLLIKDDAIELKVNFDYDTNQKLSALVIEIYDKLKHNGDIYKYSEIEDNWDDFENSPCLKHSQLKAYMKKERYIKKNWRQIAKHDDNGIKKYQHSFKTSETITTTVLSTTIGFFINFSLYLLLNTLI